MLWNQPALLALVGAAFVMFLIWLNRAVRDLPPQSEEDIEDELHWRTGGIPPLEGRPEKPHAQGAAQLLDGGADR